MAAARGGVQPRSTRRAGAAWRLAAKKPGAKRGGAKTGGGDDDFLDVSSLLADMNSLEEAIVETEDQIVNVWNFDSDTGQLVETQQVKKVPKKNRAAAASKAGGALGFDDEDGDGGALGLDGDDADEGGDGDDADDEFGWVKTRALRVDARDPEEAIDYLSSLSLDELDAESRAVILDELEAKKKARCPRRLQPTRHSTPRGTRPPRAPRPPRRPGGPPWPPRVAPQPHPPYKPALRAAASADFLAATPPPHRQFSPHPTSPPPAGEGRQGEVHPGSQRRAAAGEARDPQEAPRHRREGALRRRRSRLPRCSVARLLRHSGLPRSRPHRASRRSHRACRRTSAPSPCHRPPDPPRWRARSS